MAKITRKNQLIFGSTAGVNQIAEIGSLAAGTPVFSTDPDTIQSLSNYLNGWFDIVIGENSPAIEDMNALCYLYAYQLAYLFQAGVAEWNTSTVYYIGSLVNVAGVLYSSLTDANTGNNPASDTTNWGLVTKEITYQEFLSDDTWVCPRDISKVRVSATTYLNSQISGSNSTSLALTASANGYAWGNGSGTGIGDTASRSSPVVIAGGLVWRQISDGGTVGTAITTSGDAYAWGSTVNGTLGDGNATSSKSSPVLVIGGFKWRQLACGSNSVLGIASSGDLYAWGLNSNGQAGTGNVVPHSSPVIVLGGKKWRQIASGTNNSFGIDSSGDLYAWGSNSKGELGQGSATTPQSSPVLVLGGLKWVAVVSDTGGSNSTASLGITDSGDLYAWGANNRGQLGQGDVVFRSSPVLVLGGHKWKSVSTNQASVVGVTVDGDAYAWGYNPGGQLGLGDTIPRSSPVIVLGGKKWRQIAMTTGFSIGHCMGITSTADLYAWGYNDFGQLGLGDITPRSSPVLVLGGLKYPAVYEAQVNSVVLDVTPGQSYSVTVFGLLAMFDYVGLYQDPYNSGAMPMKITVEYEA